MVVSLLVVALGCASEYDRLVEQGRAAEKQGQVFQAARFYRQACQTGVPQDDPACRAAKMAGEDAARRALAAAGAPCHAGDVPACHVALSPALEMRPDDPRAWQMLEVAGEGHARLCEQGRGQSVSDLALVARCIAHAATIVRGPAYSTRVSEAGQRAAAAFVQLARSAEMTGYPGAQMLTYEAALSFVNDPAFHAAYQASRGRFVAEAAVPVSIRLVGSGPGSPPAAEAPCAEVRAELGERMSCSGRGDVAPAVAVRLASVRERTWTEQHSKRYVSGVRRVPNPARANVERRVVVAEIASDSDEEELLRAELECDSAWRTLQREPGDDQAREQQRYACQRYEGLKDIHERRADELHRARRDLDRTPVFLEEDVYDTHYWTSRHFEWTAPYRFDIAMGRDVHSGDGVLRQTATEQPAFHPAGVEGSSRGPEPTAADFYRAARDKAMAQVTGLVEQVLAARAGVRAQDCAGQPQWTGPWLQCRAESVFVAGSFPRAEPLMAALR